MLWTILLSFGPAIGVFGAALPAEKLTVRQAGFIPPGLDSDSSTLLTLSRGPPTLSRRLRRDVAPEVDPLATARHSSQSYMVDVTLDAQPFKLRVDTGSPHVWVVQKGFECYNNQTLVQESDCRFGTTFVADIGFGPIDGATLFEPYNDGTWNKGIFGKTNFTMGDMWVNNMVIAVVNETWWKFGDGETSGLLGLSGPAGTDSGSSMSTYDPLIAWLTNHYALPLTMALNETGGYLGFGANPPVQHGDIWAQARFPISTNANGEVSFDQYEITIDGFVWRASASASSTYNPWPWALSPVIVDSGTADIWVPKEIADEVNAVFDPPPDQYGRIPCDVGEFKQIPEFGVAIDGIALMVKPEDMISRRLSGDCYSSVFATTTGKFLLGDAWLKNVVVVHHFGNASLYFSSTYETRNFP